MDVVKPVSVAPAPVREHVRGDAKDVVTHVLDCARDVLVAARVLV